MYVTLLEKTECLIFLNSKIECLTNLLTITMQYVCQSQLQDWEHNYVVSLYICDPQMMMMMNVINANGWNKQ